MINVQVDRRKTNKDGSRESDAMFVLRNFEAAVALLEEHSKTDAWRYWDGRPRGYPRELEQGALVDVKLRSGRTLTNYADSFRWNHYGNDPGDILEYRISRSSRRRSW